MSPGSHLHIFRSRVVYLLQEVLLFCLVFGFVIEQRYSILYKTKKKTND